MMSTGAAVARRLSLRLWTARMRRAWMALCLGLAVLSGGAPVLAGAPVVLGAEFAEPTRRYPHGVLGDDEEWGALVLRVDQCPECARIKTQEVTIRLPDHRVFEDLAPRLFDLPDGRRLVAVVESDTAKGARLSIYGAGGVVTAGPFIGQTNRWLAPAGIGDMDGDGRIELAYVDRPHLAKMLRLFRLEEGDRLVELASLAGVSNHRIGWDFIVGGLRDCGAGPELVLASGDWARNVAVRFDGAMLHQRDLGAYGGSNSLAPLMGCAAE